MLSYEDLWLNVLTMFHSRCNTQVDYMCDANLRFSHSGASSVFITGYKSTTSLAMMDDDDMDDDEEEARALTRGEDDDDEDDEDEEEEDDDGLNPADGCAHEWHSHCQAEEGAASLLAALLMLQRMLLVLASASAGKCICRLAGGEQYSACIKILIQRSAWVPAT